MIKPEHPLDRLSCSDISQRIKHSLAPTFDQPVLAQPIKWRNAGVLLPLVRENGRWHLLFIRRSENLHDRHSGQVAFAGGKYEPEDNDLRATALRECAEEIGVLPQHVDILGELGDHYTISRFRVASLVGTIPWPYSLTLDPREVAHAFTIPLGWLADAHNYVVQQRQLESDGSNVPVVCFEPYQGEQVWGATARMTLSLIRALSG